MTNMTYTFKPFISLLTVGDPIGHLNLMLLPLRGNGQGHLDYLLSQEAIESGLLQISEVDKSGHVPELLVMSCAEQSILLIDGEELVGAKQNRILNTSVLVPPKTQVKIPVSCVEQGRWNYISNHFTSGGHSPSRLRARKSRDVTKNLRHSGQARSDQGAVWEEVSWYIHDAQADSPTMAMHDVIRQRQDRLTGYLDALPYPSQVRGILAASNGRFVAADLFDKPLTLEKMWRRLITGYALDAIGQAQATHGSFTPKIAQTLLEHVAEVQCQACPTVGLGEDWRLESEDVIGQALVAENVCVHLCVFPNDQNKSPQGETGHILPPSRRRRWRSYRQN